ncbi:hypothetical protein [Nostoc sp.]|uniref:hypothetical protein n=1 Tax=Nostoc sp. TaxID=1180 RepID=UPI002FF8A230
MDKLQWVKVAFRESERWFRVIFNQTFGFIGLIEPIRILMETFKFGGITSSKVIRRPLSQACWSDFSPYMESLTSILEGRGFEFLPNCREACLGGRFC